MEEYGEVEKKESKKESKHTIVYTILNKKSISAENKYHYLFTWCETIPLTMQF